MASSADVCIHAAMSSLYFSEPRAQSMESIGIVDNKSNVNFSDVGHDTLSVAHKRLKITGKLNFDKFNP